MEETSWKTECRGTQKWMNPEPLWNTEPRKKGPGKLRRWLKWIIGRRNQVRLQEVPTQLLIHRIPSSALNSRE